MNQEEHIDEVFADVVEDGDLLEEGDFVLVQVLKVVADCDVEILLVECDQIELGGLGDRRGCAGLVAEQPDFPENAPGAKDGHNLIVREVVDKVVVLLNREPEVLAVLVIGLLVLVFVAEAGD